MCWNEHVSLNTFLFSVGALALMVYNNAYTPYKVPGMNVYSYFFILSFCLMQLIEFFLWRNLNNPRKNYIYSVIGQLLITVQPVASLMLLKDTNLRTVMLGAYGVFVAWCLSIADTSKLNTKNHNGHLQWNWVKGSDTVFELVMYVFFMVFSLVVEKYYYFLAFALTLFGISFWSEHFLNRTAGSLWCWSLNSCMLAYVVYLLVYMPFKEHGILC
jgi:hypothetical protein